MVTDLLIRKSALWLTLPLDSLRTHIQGILVRNPEWATALVGYRIESAVMNGDWDSVQLTVSSASTESWEASIARLLLSIRSTDAAAFENALIDARNQIGAAVISAGERGYRRAYDSILKLHLIHDITDIRQSFLRLEREPREQILGELLNGLSSRLDATLPTFRNREPLLSMQRAAFSLR